MIIDQLIVGTSAQTLGAVIQALLLARSLRAFGGALAGQPFWLFLPHTLEKLPAELAAKVDDAGIEIKRFVLDKAPAAFPFAAKTVAAGLCEEQAQASECFLTWMDCDALILQEPQPLLLPTGAIFGYRPVDHTLIGSPANRPLDSFWSLVYKHCAVASLASPPMQASVDEQLIRPYFNAGLLVVRPAQGLLRAWSNRFLSSYLLPTFQQFFEQDVLYRIFLHQAILAGAVIARLAPAQWLELPRQVNYPLHMHSDYPTAQRARRLNDLVSCRYDTHTLANSWATEIAIDEPLRGWLAQQRSEFYADTAALLP